MIEPSTDVGLSLDQEARLLSTELRKSILMQIPETELHELLATLFRRMNPEFWVEVTHGALEFGKDLVVVRHDPLITDVAGVVVKRGDIKAKTSGDVDKVIQHVEAVLTAKGEAITQELLSQVKQSKKHSATLRSRLHNLKCSRVIVVLAGEMSGNARKRLQEEVGSGADVHDIAWLVDSFTDFYPQVFFESRAVDYLYGAIKSMDADGFHSRAGKTLTECFVEPVIAPLDRELSFDDATSVVKAQRKRIRYSELASMLGRHRRILLIGDPGSGKTKVVAKYCLDGYRAAVNKMVRRSKDDELVGIPLIVSARKFAEYKDAGALLDDQLPHDVRGRLKASTVVLDGLDEVPSDDREPLLRKAEEFAAALSATLLVTSRRLAAFSVAPKNFSRFEILPFEFGQAMKLVKRVCHNSDMLPALQKGIQTIQSQIPMNPLSIILLIEVVTERKEVPASLTELYERFLDLVFGRWDQEKGIAVLFEYMVKKRFLGTLAYHEFYRKGRLEIGAGDFEAFLQSYAALYGWNAEELRSFAKEMDRAGIIDTHQEVFFRHRSFLDFFVGYYMHEFRDELEDVQGKMVAVYFDPVWTETAFFLVGLSRRLTASQLDALFEYKDATPDVGVDKLMVGRLLQAGWHSHASVKEDGVRHVLEHIDSAVGVAREFLRALKRQVPDFFSELAALSLVQHSLGSFAVAKEGQKVLAEMQAEADLSRPALMKRAALLWALRHHMAAEDHAMVVKQFVAHVDQAKLNPVEETKFLVIAGLADPANDIMKVIGRRIRRIEADSPSALASLLPGKSQGFRPPPNVR